MDCQKIRENLSVFRELDGTTKQEIARHLAGCADCATAAAAYQQQDRLLGSLPIVQPSHALGRAVRERTVDRPRPQRRVGWAFAWAAMALLLVLGTAGGAVSLAADALPGERLYGLKLGVEQVQLALTRPEQRPALEQELVLRRQQEVREIVLRGSEADVEFQGLLEQEQDGLWVVGGLPVTVLARTWSDPPPQGSDVWIRAYATDGELIASRVRVLGPTVTPAAYGPGGQPADTPGAYGPGEHPADTPGAYGPGGQPADTPGAYGPGGQPADTPGAYGPGGQPADTPGAYGPGGQPADTPGAYGPGGQPADTPGAYGPGAQPTETPGAYGPGAQPTSTPGGYGPGGQPSVTPGASDGPGGQMSETPGAYGPGVQATVTPGGNNLEPLPSRTPTGVGPGPLPDHTPTGAPPEPLPSCTPTGIGPGPLPDHTPTGAPPEPLPSCTPTGIGPGPLPDHTPTGAPPEPLPSATPVSYGPGPWPWIMPAPYRR